MLFKWFNPSLKYAGYVGENEEYEESIIWYDNLMGNPLPENFEDWKTPILIQYLGENKKKRSPGVISDCVSGPSIHFISQKAVDVLSDIWEKHATLYPVILEDKQDVPYYMVVVHTVIDCIDREQSEGMIQKYGKNAGKGYFGSMTKWVFREEEVGDNFMFVLPDSETSIYVTEAFKQRVVDAGLTGFGFIKEPYDDDPFIS